MSNDPPAHAASRIPASDVFEVVAVLPAQFFGDRQAGAALQPEKRLMLAVLEEAVATFHKYAASETRAGRRLFVESETWIASEDRQWPYAFLNICDTLGLDAGYLRAGLHRWRDRLRAATRGPGVVIRSPFRHLTGSRTRATELRRSA